jgi:signal transduction histidine kinase
VTDQQPQWRESVFARLVTIMVATALCLMLLVSAFWLVVMPDFHDSIDRVALHERLLGLLLVVIVAVVLTAHAFLRHLLRPLRILSDGVARLGEGELDVQLPRRTDDEFGRLTDAFNHMVGRVREMIGARDRLLIDVSHELRSPLTRMKVTLEFLPADEQRARLAGDITEMEHMVTALLELERLRMGRGIATAREDLTAMLREVAQTMEDHPPGVRVVSPPLAIFADVDGEKVRIVVRNLVENAIKYSLPDSRPVELSIVEDAGTVVVRIVDDGVGIPECDAERVFEPFFRVDRSRSKGTGGFGLGLSICKRIMEANGGSIALERGAERGAAFKLTFRRAEG